MAKGYAYSGNEVLLAAISPRLRQAGYQRVSDPASAEVVITFSTMQSELEELYYGTEGYIQMVAPGSLLIDLSATTPSFARELNAVATVSDLAFVEAPLVIGDMVADDAFDRGNISCFAAGEEDGVARAREILEAVFSQIHETGGPGSAQLARAAYSMQIAAQVVSAIEADALYRSFRRSVNGSGLGNVGVGAASPAAQLMLDAVRDERFEGDYTVEMFMAELASALMAADDAELIVPQAESALHMLELLAVIGGADMSPAAIALLYGDEEACAKHGLDWTRAENAFGGHRHDHDCDCGDDCDCGCDHGHLHHDYDDYDEFGFDDFDFSNN